MTPPSPFSAADSALGYLYQVRVALLWALRRLKSGNDFLISLETFDDVTFETKGGKPEELLQTKHHQNREATLTDASEDLWKSLRVWFEGYERFRGPVRPIAVGGWCPINAIQTGSHDYRGPVTR